MPFDDFKPPAKPQNIAAYREYRRLSIDFVEARNRRIDNLDPGSDKHPADAGT